MNKDGMWKVRLFAFAAAVTCFWLAFGFMTGTPGVFMMMVLAAIVAVPVLLFTQGWLGVWLLALGGMWGSSMMLFLMNSTGGMTDFLLLLLVLAGLSGLGIAVIPPHVAAKHRAAWPFGYLNPHKAAEKAKRERLLLEEEIIYDRVPRRWDDDDYDDEDDAEALLPLPKRKSSAR